MPTAHNRPDPPISRYFSILFGTMPDGTQGYYALCGTDGCKVGLTDFGDVVPWYSSTHKSHEYVELLGERHLVAAHAEGPPSRS